MSRINIEVPNESTIQAFKETDTGIGLTKHKNLASLFEDLGLNDQRLKKKV